MELARCHICAALMPDTVDDRRTHVAVHNHDEKVIEGFRKALKGADAAVLKLRQEIADLRAELADRPTHTATSDDSLVINEIPDEDLDAELEDDEDVETDGDTDLADLHDITGTALLEAGVTAADLAPEGYPAIDRDDEDDLDLRIARQTGVIA